MKKAKPKRNETIPIKTNCPSCDAQYNVADKMRGKNVRCKACGDDFVVGRSAQPKRDPLPRSPNNQTEEAKDDREYIRTLIAEQEAAIRKRGFGQLFRKYGDAFVNGTDGTEDEQPEELLHDLRLAKQLLMSSSFIAAQYTLKNDKANRDKAAQSCAILLSSLRKDPMEWLAKHIECEAMWPLAFAAEEQDAGPNVACLVAVIIVVVIVLTLIFVF